MAASVRFRPADRDLGMVMREVDENLAIFLGLKIESKGDDPEPERTDPVHDNHLLDSEIDPTGHDQLPAKNPTGFSSPRKPELRNEAKRRPLSLSGERKLTPRVATPTGQRPIKPKPSRASTPTPIRSAFPSSKTRQKSCGASQTTKPKPSKSSETQITKVTLHRRSASASRVRPSSTTSKTREADAKGDDVNPVAMGTKMVERVVNMRKLARPKQDDESNNTKKPSGFGRLLSKNSLDMAIRHMGIKGSVHDGLSPIKTGSSSSTCGLRSSSSKNSVISVPESPVTSSSESSMSSY